MQQPLFKVKNELSEFVKLAEQGEVIELTKHGKATAILLGSETYAALTRRRANSFATLYADWKNKCATNTSAEFPYDGIRGTETASERPVW